MRRIAYVSLALAAACGTQVEGVQSPVDRIYMPTSIALHGGRLLVASSNFDLLYVGKDGGTVIPIDPSTVNPVDHSLGTLYDGVRVGSFTGDLAVGEGCGAAPPYALVASRYSNALYHLTFDADGGVHCGGAATPCEIPLQGSFVDPLAVEVVCSSGGRYSAFVAYLRSTDGLGWVSEYSLTDHTVTSFAFAGGPVRSFEYDPVRERLWMTILATSSRQSLAWMRLGGGCVPGSAASNGCTGGVPLQDLPANVELRDIAFANPEAPGQDGFVRRVYLTGRLYDPGAAALVGGRTADYGGLLVVADLVENALGGVDMQVVRTIEIGRGAGVIRVLPRRTGMRDVVAALASDEGELWLYDDQTLAVRTFGRSPTTGAPVLGHVPYAMAVERDAIPSAHGASNLARMYVASFQDSYVSALDVPLYDVDSACMLDDKFDCAADDGSKTRRITGGMR